MNRIIYYVFFAVILGSQSAQGQVSNDIDTLNNDALKLYNTNPDSSVELSTKALQMAFAINDSLRISKSSYFTARTNKRIGNYTVADSFIQISKHWCPDHNEKLVIHINSMYAQILKNQGNLESAIAQYERAIELSKEVKDTISIINNLDGLGTCHELSSQYEKAMEYYLQTVYYGELIEDKAVGITFANISILLRKMDDLVKSLAYSKKAVAANIKYGKDQYLGSAYNTLAGTYNKMGEVDSSLLYYIKTRDIGYKQKRNTYVASACLNIANIYSKDDNFNGALEYLQEGLPYSEGSRRYNDYQIMISQIRNSQGNHNEAIRSLSKIDHESLIDDNKKNYLKVLVEAQQNSNNYKKAYYTLKQLNILEDSIRKGSQQEFSRELIEKYETSQKQLQNEKLNQQNEIQQAELKTKNAYLLAGAIGLGLISLLTFLASKQSQARKMLNKELSDKNTKIALLNREILHRSKNQLNLATSLVENQKYNAQDAGARALIEESEYKLRALAMVNSKLSDDMDGINLQEVAKEIIEANGFSINKDEKLLVDVQAQDIIINPDKLSSIALIINELSVNSVKYAFQNTDQPSIELKASTDKEHICIIYTDNGIGKAEVSKEGTGSTLIKGLVHQLNGSYTEESKNGYIFTMKIPSII